MSSEQFCLLMRRDLAEAITDVPWPPEISLQPYRPALAQAVHQVLMQGYADGGGQVPTLEVWQQRFETDPEYDPDLCLIAQDAAGIVGVVQCWTSAYIKDLVVHPRARGHGLGRALLLSAFQAFRQRREGFVDLRVFEDNAQARRLYENAGMRAVRRELVPS